MSIAIRTLHATTTNARARVRPMCSSPRALLMEGEADECALLQEFMREDPHMMFRKRREEGYFRILVSRYLMDDERNSGIILESVEICSKQ